MPTLPPVHATTRPSGREKTVLVVDDFAPLCDLVARHLLHSGYRVLIASDAVEARQITESSHGQDIDLLLADLEMPAMIGDQLAEWFAAEHPRAHVLLMSHRQALPGKHRNSGVLQKPFSLEDLGKAVHQALGVVPDLATGSN